MTRWWTYAILAIALVCSRFAKAEPLPPVGCAELHASTTSSKSTACKHSGQRHQVARRDASRSEPLAIVPDSIDLPLPTAWTNVWFFVGGGRQGARIVDACSRGPPQAS